MAYIYEDELKEILPEIMSDWIDKDDESWEWIFQEIEQKCYVGTNKRKGKRWRKYIEDNIYQSKAMVDAQSTAIAAHRNDIDKLTKRVDELSNKISNLSSSHVSMNAKISTLSRDIGAAKSMAQTAKQRTEVDYTKCSKEKSDADAVQEIYDRMVGRGATREELDTFRNLIHKYDALEKKEIKINQNSCETCKYEYNKDEYCPCSLCDNHDKWENWEAKDNE